MPALKVGIFATQYPTVSGEGGIGTYTRTLVEALVELKQGAHVLTLGATAGKAIAGGIPVDIIPRHHASIIDRVLPGASSCWDIGERAMQLSRTKGLDLFEFPNWEGLGLWFALRLSIPLVVRLHTSSAETQEIDGLRTTWRLKCDISREKMQVHRADALVTHSDAHRQRMAAELSIDPGKITVIPHGITVYPRFVREHTQHCEPTVVFLGRLEKRKGALD